jgi:hypothetical protein
MSQHSSKMRMRMHRIDSNFSLLIPEEILLMNTAVFRVDLSDA